MRESEEKKKKKGKNVDADSANAESKRTLYKLVANPCDAWDS